MPVFNANGLVRQWARSIDTFETTVNRINELPDLVYFEIEERHVRNQHARIVDSMTVPEFDADVKFAALPATCNGPGGGTAGALM